VTRRLAAVFAHPDDDAYGVGGWMAMNPDADVTIVLATSGGAGEIADPSLATREDLTEVREREEREFLAAVGHGDADLRLLRYPDGDLKGVPREELAERIAEILVETRPHVVVTSGPEGVTGHEDHIAAGAACTDAFRQARERTDDPAALQRLYYSSISASDVDRFFAMLRDRGIHVGNPGDPFMPRGVPDDTIAVRMDVRQVFPQKLAGIKAHRTQAVELGAIPDDLRQEALGEDSYVQAWPERRPGGPVASDLFESISVE
jgi:LmbE family N-acetylglucosaminyl deacetylase